MLVWLETACERESSKNNIVDGFYSPFRSSSSSHERICYVYSQHFSIPLRSLFVFIVFFVAVHFSCSRAIDNIGSIFKRESNSFVS